MTGEPHEIATPAGHLDVAITGWLQDVVPAALRPVLDAASHAGGSVGWVVIIALSFWWSGSRLGVRVALVASASALANVLFKWIFLEPRPYFLSDRVAALEAADGFGMPSGHAQGSAATWGAVAHWGGVRWLWMAGAVATFLSGLARVYYGVHSVLQVTCGWLLGATAVMLAATLERPVTRWWKSASAPARWSIAVLPSLLLLGAGLLLRELVLSGWEAPADWVARHRATALRLDAWRGTTDLRLVDVSALARWTGGFLGASVVAAWYGTPARPALTATSRRQSLVATAIGLPAMAAILAGGELLIESLGEWVELARFAVLLWVAAVLVPVVAQRVERAAARPSSRP